MFVYIYIYIYIVVRRRKNSRTERHIQLKFTTNNLWKISSSTVVFSTPHFHWFKRYGPWKLGNAPRNAPKNAPLGPNTHPIQPQLIRKQQRHSTQKFPTLDSLPPTHRILILLPSLTALLGLMRHASPFPGIDII